MLDSNLRQAEKDDPAEVAKIGFEAMMEGKGYVVSGWKSKLQAHSLMSLRQKQWPSCTGGKPNQAPANVDRGKILKWCRTRQSK